MDQMDPPMRKVALQFLLPYYEKNKNLDRPVAVLMQLGVEAEMPYGIVNDVMDKLGTRTQSRFVSSSWLPLPATRTTSTWRYRLQLQLILRV